MPQADPFWEGVDAVPNPFQWPCEARNLHVAGAMCSFHGRSAADMGRDELLLFVGFLDRAASALAARLPGGQA